MPRVSVIVPSYNHGKYIAESIQSILDQTYQDFEIIITDDGSSDNTVDVIKSFTDPRIQLFCFSSNQGAAVAANNCIKEAKGEFIALLNSDDVFMINKLEKQVNFLDENLNIGAVFSHVQFIDENSQIMRNEDHIKYQNFQQNNKTRFEWLNYFFHRGNCLCHPSILIRKECYEKVGFYDQRLAQLPDFEFWIRLCQHYEIFIMPKQLIKFRIRNNEANVSADKPESIRRMYVEYPLVFQQYLTPSVFENIDKIFPEIKEQSIFKNYDFNAKAASIFIAKLALSSPISALNYFGINTLYKLLEQNSLNDFSLNNLEINYIDFIKITGKFDIFMNPHTLNTIEIVKNSNLWKIWHKWRSFKKVFYPKSLKSK